MKKLFYEDINLTTFTATVLSCAYNEEKHLYCIVLDATAFFPEEGGQSADKGTLNGSPVTDVQIENDTIFHYTKQPFEIGSIVTGQVDWSQRFDFMQQHSGEHILSGLVHKHFGYNNVGFHLSVNEVTLDFDGELNEEQLRSLEQEANQVIYNNLPVEISYPSADESKALTYRSKIEIDGQLRIVTIPGIDICACCAPHVSFTGAIGMIKIVNCQSHRGGVRLNILCGQRALDDFNAKQNSVSAISVLLSAKQSQVTDAVIRLKEEIQRQKERNNTLQEQYLNLSLSTLPTPEEATHAILFVNDMDTIAIRNAVNLLIERYTGYSAIFSGNEEDGYQFIAGSKNADCRILAQTLRQNLSAKCGGSTPMIQGSIKASSQNIKEAIEQANPPSHN